MKHPIPEAALKKHIAILGMNGSGKTSVAKSQIMEPALEAGERVCNIDPTGVGWGLRLSATGKSKGFAVYIVGGDRADFPLFSRDGKAWAEIVGTSSDSFVFDTSAMTVEDRSNWFTAFAETLIRKNKGPLKLVIDEAHLFAPQGGSKSGGVAPKMLHATNNLLALGRSRGLRITMISQRPAKLHKDSLTQAHTLIAMALMAPQDRNAVKEWIADQADAERGKEIIASLPTLSPGEGWIWAPKEKVLQRVKFARPRTFDSSSAPDDDSGNVIELAPINPDVIKAKLATVARETVANDPSALKAALYARDRELADLKRAAAATPVADPKAIEQAEQRGYARGEAETAGIWFRRGAETIVERVRVYIGGFDLAAVLTKEMATWKSIGAVPSAPPVARPAQQPIPKPTPIRQPAGANGSTAPLAKAERKVLTALAQYPDGRTKVQVAVLAGYAVNGGGFNNAVSRMRTIGYLQGEGDNLSITQDGIDALGAYDPLPHGDALLQHWMGSLGKAERETLKAVVDVYPQSLTKEQVAEAAGYQAGGGGFNNAVSRLRTLELVTGRGELRASEHLFG